MNKKNFIVTLMLLSLLIIANETLADQRSYVWTYEYITVEKGKAELETYFTLSTPDIGKIKESMGAEHQVELEVGMNDRFDFSVYQRFSQSPNEQLKYDGFELRARYKLVEKGKLFIDPLIYAEYIGKPNFSKHVIELKLILAKDIGRLNISANPIMEIASGEETEMEMEYAVGINYKISNLLKVGIEGKGSEYAHYIGPVISHGKDNLWVTLGSAFKIAGDENVGSEFQVRMIMGVVIN